MDEIHQEFMRRALEKAAESVAKGGFPAGAVVVRNGVIIGEGISIGNILKDATSHGEMAAIRDAFKHINNADLSEADLYSSMHPCVMCMGAAMWGSVSRIFFACSKEKVSAEYYGGHYDSAQINRGFLRPMELVHMAEMEPASLAIIRQWEISQGL